MPELAFGLTVAHHKALLPVEDSGLREHLAEQAVRDGWTVERLTVAVRAAADTEPLPVIRQQRPIALDSVRAARDEFKRLTPHRLRRDWERMSRAEKRRTRGWMVEMVAQMQELLGSLPEGEE